MSFKLSFNTSCKSSLGVVCLLRLRLLVAPRPFDDEREDVARVLEDERELLRGADLPEERLEVALPPDELLRLPPELLRPEDDVPRLPEEPELPDEDERLLPDVDFRPPELRLGDEEVRLLEEPERPDDWLRDFFIDNWFLQ